MLIAAGFAESFGTALGGVWHFIVTGGWAMAPILVCSFIMLAVISWKVADLGEERIQPGLLKRQLEEVAGRPSAVSFKALQQTMAHDDSVLAKICQAAFATTHTSHASALRAAESAGREEVSGMERGIGVLELVFTVSPMLGLIGTVSGLVRIFGNFGGVGRGADQAAQIAAGISEAMIATIAGLAVAVPAVIAQFWFSRRVERAALRMGTIVNRALDAVWRDEPTA